MTAPTEKPSRRGFWRGVGVFLASVVLGVLGAGIGLAGFAVSFGTLTNIAKPVVKGDIPGTDIPWAALLPATIDGGIMFLSAMRIIQAVRGKRSPVVEILEYVFIGVTIILNASEGDTLRDRAIHASFPAIYVVVVAVGTVVLLGKFETIREKVKADSLTFARWILAPFDTGSLWKNMKIANTRSFATAIRLEEHKIAQYQTWRRDRGTWWWLPFHAKSVSRADRKALRIELAKIAINASRPIGDVPTASPAPSPAVPIARPNDVPVLSPAVPAEHPAAIPHVPAPVSRPRPLVPAASSRDIPADPEMLVPGETTRIGDLGFTTLYTPEQHKQAIKAALRDFLDPAVESPYTSQADIARAFQSSTSEVSRLAKQIRNERVNGSAGSS